MFQEEFKAVCSAGEKKNQFFKKNPAGYFISAMVAGMFISFGSFVTYVMSTPLKEAGDPMMKAVMAFCFASALSLVICAGAELFTGNNFVMASASLNKNVSWGDTIKLWIICYIGNFAGSWILVGLFQMTGVPAGAVGESFAASAAAKMALPLGQMFVRAILCNILVCLAVWCSIKLKSEVAKLIMVFWCIFVFMICGFEHSVANMSIMGTGLLNAADASVSIGGYFYNLLVVTGGNMIGAILFVSIPYFMAAREK